MSRKMIFVALGLMTLAAGAWAQTAAMSRYGKAERRDPIFLRFPEMAERFWVNNETMAASHKVVAVPMPKQCSFLYADTYTRNQMSESEVQQMALSNCNVCHVAGPMMPKVGSSPPFLKVPVMNCATNARVGLTAPAA